MALRSSSDLSLFANLVRGKMKEFLQVFCLLVCLFVFFLTVGATFCVSWICKGIVEKYNERNEYTFCEENS